MKAIKKAPQIAELFLCQLADSNCGHTDFQSVALPPELSWLVTRFGSK